MITPEFLSRVCSALADGNAHQPDIAKTLREAFPGMSFSLCMDNDIPSRIPALAQGEGFALYGIDTSGHCASLTSSPESATGLAIALIDDEE